MKKKERQYFYNPQCQFCGQFIKFKGRKVITWAEYGHWYDLEPPDPCFAHAKCWNKIKIDYKLLIARISWSKPVYMHTGKLARGLEGY